MLSVTTESGNRLKTTKSHVDLSNELTTEVYGEDNCNELKSAVFDLASLSLHYYIQFSNANHINLCKNITK